MTDPGRHRLRSLFRKAPTARAMICNDSGRLAESIPVAVTLGAVDIKLR
jgi:hypothetical protein